jgi:hypothetical protein
MSNILTAMLKKKLSRAPHIYPKFRGVADIYVNIWLWHSMLFLFVWSVHNFGSSENLPGANWSFNTVFTMAPFWLLPHQTNQLHTLLHCCFKIHFTLMPFIHWSDKCSLSLRFSLLSCMQFCSQPCMVHVPCIWSYLIWTPY